MNDDNWKKLLAYVKRREEEHEALKNRVTALEAALRDNGIYSDGASFNQCANHGKERAAVDGEEFCQECLDDYKHYENGRAWASAGLK